MKKILSVFLLIFIILLSFSACTRQISTQAPPATDLKQPATQNESPAPSEPVQNEDELFSSRDSKTDYDESSCIIITLDGNSALSSTQDVEIDSGKITITKEGTYKISGTLDNGQIIINASKTAKIHLVLDSASIASKNSAPLYIALADKVFVTLIGESTLSSGESFEESELGIDAAVFSKEDLTLNGSGTLNIISPAGHGIVCKDDLVFTGGAYNINAASHALDANDSIRIKNAGITARAGKDGLHAENNDDASKGFIYIANAVLDIQAEGDGISSGSYLNITACEISILAGGGYENGEKHSSDNFGGFPGGGGYHGGGRPRESGGQMSDLQSTDDSGTSMKGLKASGEIIINSGNFTIDSADDSIHSDLSLTLNGGGFEIASGDDALHAEEILTVNAGSINISTSYEGIEALHIYINGGNIKMVAADDGLNAAGGIDASGEGGRDTMFGGYPGGGFGGMSANSNGSIVISGGTLYINSSGDGIDANGTLEISGGHTTIVGPTQGDTTTLDYDKTGVITGGTFIGTGSSMMAQSFSDSSQGVIALQVGTQAQGTKITLTDKDGNIIVEHIPELSYQIVIISTPDMKKGEVYTITVGSQSGEFEAS